MTDSGHPMTDKVSMKEVRAYVKRKANEAAAWQRLDAELGKYADLDRILASRQAEVDSLNDKIAKGNDALVAANQEAGAVVERARVQAEEIIHHANKSKADAEKRAASVDAILADARTEADRIVGRGRVEGEKLAKELEGRIPKAQAALKSLDDEKTRIANAVAALETRRDKAESDLASILKRISA